MNVSSANSVDLIRRAKARGVRVTAEVCPHHFSLTDDCLRSFDSNCKVNPPLRDQSCVDACIEGLIDGTLDVITSGHSPRALEKKMQELSRAPFGCIGLETVLGVVVSNIIEPGHLDWMTALAKLTCNPADVLGLDKGTLQVGSDADVTLIDPNIPWTVTPERLKSKSFNTPLSGRQLRGRADIVIVGGEIKFQRSKSSKSMEISR